MKLLEARGYIESCGRQGKFIKAVPDNTMHSPIRGLIAADRKNLAHLLETIKVTAGETAWYASTRIGEKEIIKLREQLREQKSLSSRTNPATRLEHWLTFTANLAESSRNNVLCHVHLSLCQMLSEVMQETCLEVFSNREQYSQMYAYMEDVLDAIQSGRSDEARNIMHRKSDFFREIALKRTEIPA